MHKHPSRDTLRDQFVYHEDTGILERVRFIRRFNVLPKDGRRNLRVNGSYLTMSTAVWIYHNGDVPPGLHVCTVGPDPADTRLSNLCLRSHSANQHRTKSRQTPWGVSGYRGVFPISYGYYVKISRGNTEHRLGGFTTAEAAARAYNELALKLFGADAALNEGV
jgi:hypothetical protein